MFTVIIAAVVGLVIGVVLGVNGAYLENREYCKGANISWWQFVTFRW